jgi:hypothetical protein
VSFAIGFPPTVVVRPDMLAHVLVGISKDEPNTRLVFWSCEHTHTPSEDRQTEISSARSEFHATQLP